MLPPFPPKKLLPLTSGQLEERRILLEKYIQSSKATNRVRNDKFFPSKMSESFNLETLKFFSLIFPEM